VKRIAISEVEVNDGAEKVDSDNAPAADNDNSAASSPIWESQKAETEWKRWSRLYGKDLVGIIPPNAETASHLGKNRGKIPGYKKRDGTWCGRSKSLTKDDTTREELEHWARDCARIGIMSRTCAGFDNDASDLRIRDGLRDIVNKWAGRGPVRGRSNSYRDLHMVLGPRLTSWQIRYRPPGKPEGEKPDLFELKANGQYYNVEGPHPSGVPYEWTNAHPCDEAGPDGLPKVDQSIADQIYVDALAFLKAEDCEIIEGGGSPSSGPTGVSAQKQIGDPSLLAPSLDAVAEALTLYPNTAKNLATHKDFVTFVIATKAACGGDEEFYAEHFEPWALTPLPGKSAGKLHKSARSTS
jgi:hypothetical protein